MASSFDKVASVNLLTNIRELDDFYDVVLVAGLDEKKFPVHRVIMAASNRYFNALLGPNFKEAQQNEVVLNDIDGTTLKTIIDYCYCCKIEINDENVDDIVAAASRMDIVTLVQQCENFYQSILSIDNCLKTLALADTFNLRRLRKDSLLLACETFARLPEADLLELDQRNLNSILKQNLIDAPEDLIAYRFAQWCLHDPDKRKKHVQFTAKWIRLEHISEKAMSTVMEPFYLRYGCFGFTVAENRKRYKNKTPIILNRLADTNSLYAVETIYYDDTRNRIALHEFVEETRTFNMLYEVAFGGDVKNVLFLRGKLYVFLCDSVRVITESLDLTVHSAYWYSLDLVTRKIEQQNDLPFRSRSSPVIVDSYFYLFSEFDPFDTRPHNFACYDTKYRTWEYRKSFPSEFHDLNAIELNNLIYVTGEMPAKNFWSSNFWCYDPTDDSWSEKARINTIIVGGKHLIKVNNFICLINYNMDTSMVYDPTSNQWNTEWNLDDLKKDYSQLEQRIYQTAKFRGRTFGILSCNRRHYCVHLEATAKSCEVKFISNPDFRWMDVGVFVYKSMREKTCVVQY